MTGRIVGVVYLLYFVAAIAGELVSEQAGISGFTTSSDAAATANLILGHQAAFQLGFVLSSISVALYVAVTALFYVMFSPVNRTLAVMATFFSLVGQAVAAAGSILQLAPLAILSGDHYLSVFDLQQLQALALLFLNVSGQTNEIALLFDGLFLIVLGYLIFGSALVPRAIGVLVVLAGLAWLTFLAPPLARALATPVEVLGVVGEGALMLWLIVKGVNERRVPEVAR